MRVVLFGFAISAIVLTSSCSKPHHDVAFYTSHQGEMKSEVAACDNDPATAQKDPNCINAYQASSQLAFAQRAAAENALRAAR